MRRIVRGRVGLSACLLAMMGSTATAQQPARPQTGRPTAGARPAPAQGGNPAPDPSQAQPRGVDPAAAQEMETILQQWEQRSSLDKTLYAEFTRTDKTTTPGFADDLIKFQGVALLQSPNLACIEFKRVQVDAKGQTLPNPPFHERIVCTGNDVYHFYAPSKEVFVYPLDKDQRKRSIEEGPLPFLFNMKSADAKRRYYIELLQKKPTKDGSPGAIIRIVPRIDIDQSEFSQAIVLLNLKTFLPEALQLYSPNGKDTKTYIFSKVERNGENNPSTRPNNYNGSMMADMFRKSGYKVLVNPAPQPNQAGRPAGGAARRPLPRRPGGPAALAEVPRWWVAC